MRTISFRGKNTVTGEWEYGYFWKDDICGDCHIREGNGIEHRVDPETVSQLVCVADAGGEIYEGDYIQDEDNNIWLVEYSELSHAFVTTSQDGMPVSEDSEWLESEPYISIIGNIWDNSLEDFQEEENEH